MTSRWQRTLFRIVFWISAEIILNLLNLDTLADYSEFLFEKQVLLTQPQPMLQQGLNIAAASPADALN